MRLLRPRVRAGLRVTACYLGAYRGSWFAIEARKAEPFLPPDRVNLGKRRRELRR